MRGRDYFAGYWDAGSSDALSPDDAALMGWLFAESYEAGLLDGEEANRRGDALCSPEGAGDWMEHARTGVM